MGKVTQDAIHTKLIQKIHSEWKSLRWIGINVDMIDDIERVEPTLAVDFKYEGSGEYDFSARISFWVKNSEHADDLHNLSYRIFPSCKVFIQETEGGFTTNIVPPIYLQKSY